MNSLLDELNPDRLLTTAETAHLLGVSVAFLEVKGRKNGPRHVHLSPGCVRYKLADIRGWIDSRTFQTTAEAARDGNKLARGPNQGCSVLLTLTDMPGRDAG
jgi:predicted DNA-binding transcriptional regulator AlpA